MIRLAFGTASALLGCITPASGLDVTVGTAMVAGAPGAPAPCNCTVIPALTPVSIEILAPVGSKTSKSGDPFPIRLAAPIVIDGKVVVSAGASGIGEVVHAKKGGGMGAPGELVLAVRFVDLGGRRLKLRSLRLSAIGQDNIGTAQLASAALGMFSLLVKGGNIELPAGVTAEAKTAESFEIASPPPVEAVPSTLSEAKI